MTMKLFARLTKVDEEKRLVYGRATEEVVDRAGEIMDYASSKPFFEKWSGEIAKATDGKSLGNVRAMHGNVAAGKLTAIDFLDDAKAIDVCAKIVDDAEWNKVLEGVYTGFSIGGSYHKTWTDTEAKARRFTADPCELSIVDLPCVPTASFFDIQKADGSVMQKAFKPAEVTADSFSDEVAELAKSGVLTMAEMLEAIRLAKAKKDTGNDDGNPKGEYGDVAYADEKNKKYPIDTTEHIRAAWNYIHQEKNADEYSASELKTIKDRIIAAWKKEIDKDGPPESTEAADKTVQPVLTKAGKKVVLSSDNLRKVGFLALHKGMDRVGSFAYLLSSVLSLQQGSAAEEAREGDDSTMPDELKAWLKQGGDLLSAMVAEEVEEMVDGDGVVCMPDYYYCGWAAMAEGLEKEAVAAGGERKEFLHKVGARNSKADQQRVQDAHDLLAELGAGCNPDNYASADADKAAHAETLKKLTTADESLKKLTGDLAAANEALVKVADERDELAKSKTELTEQRDALQKKHDELTVERDTLQKKADEQAALIEKMKVEPAVPKGALRAIEKSHDLIVNADPAAVEEVEPVRKADGTIDETATAIKKARRMGGVVVQRG
ncbi:DUF6582 domain-containing protein [Trinickia mobilis]|uniref:DUF6582 domain-containing protein n=1 Tax=Trinickia mobilis TaxID=2816356 RepID=UPI001A909B73|nr:DUF6582 domain-containing protein [Trinickia mobilis]